jgi:hypothetical protein
VTPATIVRFVLSLAIGSGLAAGIALATAPPAIRSTAHAGLPVSVTASQSTVDFALQPDHPEPIAPLPATATLQLTSFKQAAPSFAPAAGGAAAAPWWNASMPRVTPVSQFDGGPLQNVNCTMASAAMLARLGFGIVTTGSQLRALQDDQDGGTDIGDVETAVSRGWGVRFFKGALSAVQLRALLYAGAGALVVGNYAEIPVDLRLQKDFTGNHAIYVDAFRPPGPDGPAAYYVIDPLGHTWQGYRGGWWPADIVERFAMALGGGSISTAWAFAGGIVPPDHKVLPLSAYPSATAPGTTPAPGTTLAPGETGAPGESPAPSPSVTVTSDPMPAGDQPIGTDPEGGDPPPTNPKFPITDFKTNVFQVDPGTQTCLAVPPPRGCPRGIVGVIDLGGGGVKATAAPFDRLKILYANAIALGTYQIVFEAPPSSTPSFVAWGSSGGSVIDATSVEPAALGSQSVAVATITLDPASDYSFVATATGDGVRSISSVGSITVAR